MTALIEDNGKFKYFYVEDDEENNQLSFCGFKPVQEPKVNPNSGCYIVPNPEKIVPETDVEDIIEKLKEDHPELAKGIIKSVRERVFPKKTRIVLRVRLETTLVKYIVIVKGDDIKVKKIEVLKENLKPLTPKE